MEQIMSNMAYCRFENTVADLRDCEEHIYDDDISESEEAARQRLILICKKILQGQNYKVEKMD